MAQNNYYLNSQTARKIAKSFENLLEMEDKLIDKLENGSVDYHIELPISDGSIIIADLTIRK